MFSRSQASKANNDVDISNNKMSTICENVEQNGNNNNYNVNEDDVVTSNVAPTTNRRNSRLSIRGFGSILGKKRDERKFSLYQLTNESLPRLDNYRASKRNIKRPSIGEMHGEPGREQRLPIPDPLSETGTTTGHSVKLGWIMGVMIPCLLNIWGVMLFLRLSWVIGESGILQTLAIIAISAVVCVVTTLSLSAICTNGEVKSGGVYFIISRSLGPEFGASVGVVFAFANAVAASMNTIGFCESLNDLLKQNDLKIIDNGINDIRIVGVCAILLLTFICCVGMEWETKAQNFLLATIIIAIFNFLIGAAIGPLGNEEYISKGFVGFSWDVFKENFGSDYRFSEGVQQNSFSVFAIYFPSVTGIQAGANICGDLKDPGAAIPKGTFWALLISMSSYVIFTFFAGSAAVRDASGNVADLVNGSIISSSLPCKLNNTCEFGLANSYSVMQLMSLWEPLIYAGCFAATLSTALTNLLSVPRLVQALGIDQIYPGLIFFSKPYGKHGEPYRGYVLTFIISAGFLLIGQLNVIAPLISTFYLASYALINFCTFHAAFVKPLGWRPTFKYYNLWLSLFGFLLCIVIMFLIDWMASLITLVIIFALYLVVMYRKPEANWGSTTQAQQYKATLTSVYRLQNVSDHVKNYNPQVLVLSGDPKIRPPLIDFGYLLTKQNSLMFVGNILPKSIGYKNSQKIIKEGQKYLDERKIKAFYTLIDGFNMDDGVKIMAKCTGLGKMSPNIVLIGYKNNWFNCRKEEVETYFNILYNSFSQRLGVVILRLNNGLDFSGVKLECTTPTTPMQDFQIVRTFGFNNPVSVASVTASELLHVDSNLNLASLDTPNIGIAESEPNLVDLNEFNENRNDNSNDSVNTLRSNMLTVFTRKQPKSTIDVFWLYDDGGLTMLLPHIISMRSNWKQCDLRIFALSHGKDEKAEEKSMANLLIKFRIQYSELIMLKGLSDRPKLETINKHKSLIQNFCQQATNEFSITEHELRSLEEKTWRQLRIHELIVEYSFKASLVVMSLPMPRREAISTPLYMSWLEMLTTDIKCPIVLARGNQTPVLTFYS
ncbi:bumetanide-sensitive sodium-(potassium)-chloride cotransporter-like isoform X2 [Teleopsis dalmanni]|uniref:bumetanide-sensitive sodium-(potassium)-chloride cotransporter-like isoform X2 n=1 Tax=Teleopsis dalmanni TaxID=139649 RepID=UPI0018CD20EE|nr:bumetanide-sensitive sodium-(potassium)-chloride cotransporter-like isoform X2 [Teleopsis dalmanni]